MPGQFELAAGSGHRRAHGETQRHELDRRPRRRAREQRLVGRFEGDPGLGLGENRRQDDGDFTALTDIAHVGEATDGPVLDVGAGEAQDIERILLETRKNPLCRSQIRTRQCGGEARDAIDPCGRHQHPDRAARPCARRTDDAADAQLACHVPGMDGPRPTRRQKCIFRRHPAAFRDGDTRRAGHVLVDHVVHAEGRAPWLDTQRIGQLAERRFRRHRVDLHRATQEEIGIEITQRQVGIGHRGLGATSAVARGTWLRAAALRSDIQCAEIALVRDRATTGADLDQLDRGDLDRQTGAAQETLLARRLEAPGDDRLTVVDQRELGGRPAHVEGQHSLEACIASEPCPGQRPCRGPAFQQLDRRALGLADVCETTVGQHEEQPARNALGAQRLLQPLEIDLGQGPDIGVGHRRAGTQIFADFRRNVGGKRNRQVLEALGNRRSDRALVSRIGVGVQEADGQAFHALLHKVGHLGKRCADIERDLYGAVRAHPFLRFTTPGALHQRLRHLDEKIVELIFALARDLQHIAEARRGEQPGFRAFALDQRIGEQRRGMHDAADLLRRGARLLQHAPRALQGPAGRIVGCRAFFPDDGPSVAGIMDDEVGEGSPDVDPEGKRRTHYTSFAIRPSHCPAWRPSPSAPGP